MAKDHHNYSADKDMVENIQEFLEETEEGSRHNSKGNHGLPANERIHNRRETDEKINPDLETEAPVYGAGLTQPLPGEFRKQK